ncbi:uncharacterized protein LOC113469066 [Diaphorina citri]|uniref:Uncharacterized protein LOC113469066 n=1 Tax=Diaphorina citri TaxID=121845 RepID=A0A3Q0J1E2_DIACI|nr:uncharacterized protein LOC113469066 [Diaphorina citri]
MTWCGTYGAAGTSSSLVFLLILCSCNSPSSAGLFDAAIGTGLSLGGSILNGTSDRNYNNNNLATPRSAGIGASIGVPGFSVGGSIGAGLNDRNINNNNLGTTPNGK